jgi:NADPH-dependent curcumin reductase CurA
MAEMNRRWKLKTRPQGMVQAENFEFVAEPVPQPAEGQFVARVLCLSFDPTQRGWLIDAPSYLPPVAIGEVMRAGAVAQVVASAHSGFKVGQLVQGTFGWQDYALSDGATQTGPVTHLAPGVRPEHALGVFGITGLTAYFGLLDIGRPEPGDTVLVTGAAGATGSVAGQIAKLKGCRVIGVAGGPEKCRWVKEVAGFDDCIDYKSEDVFHRMKAVAPKGFNVYFENVGGPVFDAGLMNLAMRARVVLCGGISNYDDMANAYGPKMYMNLVVMRARMEGFIVLDYAARFPEAVKQLAAWVASGELKVAEDLQVGLENAPATLQRLFRGQNLGKQLLKVADPPLPPAV